MPGDGRLSGCVAVVGRAADRQQVSAGARASPSWIGVQRRPTRGELSHAVYPRGLEAREKERKNRNWPAVSFLGSTFSSGSVL